MLILELDKIEPAEPWVPVAPDTYQTYPGIIDIESWYTADASPTERMFITNFIEDATVFYSKVSTLAACISTGSTFFWDEDDQVLTVHFADGSSWYTSDYSYSKVSGFTDQTVVYIDDIEYLPLVTSVPGVAQQQDLVNYSKLALVNGTIVLDNKFTRNGQNIFDYLVDEEIYGNFINMKLLDPADIDNGSATRTDLVDLAAFYVEDYDLGIQELTIRVQDRRKSQNATIPKEVFTTGFYPDIEDRYISKPIPLIYGPIAEFPCIPVTGGATGDVTFKVAKTLTAIGQIQVFKDDAWIDVTALSTDLTNGEFELSYVDCRKGGSVSGFLLSVRVESCTGEAITDSADVIRLINLDAQGTTFTDSNYDTTEWASEKASLSQIGIAFQEKIEVFEAIRQIQNGSNVGFRYEIKPDGRRTIRIDNDARASSRTVQNVYIRNRAELTVQTDSELIAATATINYKKNYQEGNFRTYFDDTRRTDVLKRYLQEPDLPNETFLQTEALAQDKAEWILDRFDTIPRFCNIELIGKEWYDLRIYDTMVVELTNGFVDLDANTVSGRSFYGIWKVKVVGVDPQFSELINSAQIQLIEKIGG